MTQKIPYLIVGAGAAGCAAAKCFAAAEIAQQVIWIEQHAEPGGCAGYFSRGRPLRSFDAGATQLIECGLEALQERIYSLAPARNQPSAEAVFEKIPAITQHWPDQNRSVQLRDDGRVLWTSARAPTGEELKELERLEYFLKVSATEAQWMWNLMSEIPRFPPQSFGDFVRALQLFFKVPWRKKLIFPYLFGTHARSVMTRHGISKSGLANDVISGLLIDTTQSSPEKSPWLAAAMGLSILSRGIYRCQKGMRSYFRPIVSSFEERQGTYLPHTRLMKIESCPEGFKLTSRRTKESEDKNQIVTSAALLNLTVWDIVNGLVPHNDPLTKTKTYRTWERRATAAKGWGAFAIYATVVDQLKWPEHPLYHQIFPRASELPALNTSLYVSIPARSDPANPTGLRVLTATLHVDAQALTSEERQLFTEQLTQRIQLALGVTLENIESAHPGTFEHYTARRSGQVGGLPMSLANFMFFATPSRLVHPGNKSTQLLLMGDTVFPGQGVVACTVSGIAAFERATNLTFRSLLRKHFGLSGRQ